MLRLQTPLPERYTDARPRRARRPDRARPRPRSATGSSSSATTTSATRSCAGPTPAATRTGCRCSPRSDPEAEYIVFCGVHFMAESADILTADHQQVILPDLNAGCSMADMADLDEVEEAWEALAGVIDIERLVPITYMNSSAALKAFVGRHGGAVCTSTNARAVLEWALDRGDKVLFFPDQHLGRNTGLAMGYGHDDMRVWNPRLELGGLTEADVQGGHLPAVEGPLLGPPAVPARARRGLPGRAPRRHRRRPPRVRPRGRASWPTRSARPTTSSGPSRRRRPGSVIAVGTEIHLVSGWRTRPRQDGRLARPADLPVLDDVPHRRRPTWPGCSRTWSTGRVVNRITVDAETAEWARVALQRMLDIT